MRKTSRESVFWVSYSDLLTSLFFVMLVILVIMLRREARKVEDLERKLRVYKIVEENLKPLKEDKSLFRYEEKFKRFTLAFDVKFRINRYKIDFDDIEVQPDLTIKNIILAGYKLQKVLEELLKARGRDSLLNNVSYLVIIAGYASRIGEEYHNYELSYRRALSLWDFWRQNGINFENSRYSDLIDLQIAGNGWGGIGRIVGDEELNQRFVIQIIPKISKTDY